MRALSLPFALVTAALAALSLSGCASHDSSVGGSQSQLNGGSCTPGATKKADDGCNTCTCPADGQGWQCTLMGCQAGGSGGSGGGSGGGSTAGAAGASPDQCYPGDTKPSPDGCNTCTCAADGSGWACTEKGCVPGGEGGAGGAGGASGEAGASGAGGSTCIPGSLTPAPDGCNVCACNPDGESYSCTKKACPPGSAGAGGSSPDNCVPGDVQPAPDGCNTCTCNAEGTGWACTEKGCGGGSGGAGGAAHSSPCGPIELDDVCPPGGQCCPLAGTLYDSAKKCVRQASLTCSTACGGGELNACYQVTYPDGHVDLLITSTSQGLPPELEALGVKLGSCTTIDPANFPPCP